MTAWYPQAGDRRRVVSIGLGHVDSDAGTLGIVELDNGTPQN